MSTAPSQQTTTFGGTAAPTSTQAVSAAITEARRSPGRHAVTGGMTVFTPSEMSPSRTHGFVLLSAPQDDQATHGMYFASVAAPWAGSFSVGAAIGYSLPAGHSLRRTRGDSGHSVISDREIFWFDSVPLLGAVFGSMCGCFVAHYMGRRGSLILACVGSLASWLAIFGASVDSWHLLIARVVGGLCTGMIALTAPAYIAETAEAKDRGKLCGAHQTSIAAGVLYIYVLGRYLEWPWLAAFCGMPPAVTVLLMFLAVDSPRWLIEHDRHEEAQKVLMFLRETTAQAAAEYEEIEGIFRKSPTPLFHYMMAVLVMVIQQFSGVNLVLLYASSPAQAGIASTQYDMFIMLASVQLVVTATAAHMLDALGRVKPLALSAVFSTGSVMALATVYYGASFQDTSEEMNFAALIAVISKIAFTISYSSGLGPAPWCLAAELTPLRGNGFEFGSVCAFHWASALAITSVYSIMGTTTARLALLICLSSAVTFTGGIIAFRLMPDTRRVSLETILVSGQRPKSRRSSSEPRQPSVSKASPPRHKDSVRDELSEGRESSQYKSLNLEQASTLAKSKTKVKAQSKAQAEAKTEAEGKDKI